MSGTGGVRVKICGLTRCRDAALAVLCGADYLGFIFAASPRRLDADRAAAIIRSLQGLERAPACQRVGVFVNSGGKIIRDTARRAALTMLQLHGDEPPEFCRLFDLPVIKALRVRDRGIFDLVRRYDTDYILLEPYVSGLYGGTGVQADWALAAEVVRTFPQRQFFLAGGLGPHNVEAAIESVKPFAVDASSALESGPGIKDRSKLSKFMEAVRKQ
jgi:phosphoribosylanthranilate isomerase